MATKSGATGCSPFTHWAVPQGIKYSGLTPTNLPGRGLGMVATRVIEEDEDLLTVPSRIMLTIGSIHASFLGLATQWEAWRGTWPTMQTMRECMPTLWLHHPLCSASPDDHDSRILDILPPSVSGAWSTVAKDPKAIGTDTIYQSILPKQQASLKKAWECILNVFPKTEWNVFCHNWLIVNTRSFYYVGAEMEAPEDWNDAVGLVPFADYFNHADDPSCAASFEDHEYHFRSTGRIQKGEEVLISYGSHPNDFLFVECKYRPHDGFFLDNDLSDAIFLDDIVLKTLTHTERARGARVAQSLWVRYVTAKGVCSRTRVVANLKYLDRESWRRLVSGKPEKGVGLVKSMNIVRGWVELYLNESLTVVGALENLSKEAPVYLSTVLPTVSKRWSQARQLCEIALKSMDTA
ncbi:SET domain-containing protein [Aspergillus undulatus]|uniref:SET domain-containing protein n=1 Tax=Aspergillus undulatus TaxID=1810928 RepID=UPI003CCCC6E3